MGLRKPIISTTESQMKSLVEIFIRDPHGYFGQSKGDYPYFPALELHDDYQGIIEWAFQENQK